MSKKPKLFGCAACPWGNDKATSFVPPELSQSPELIILGEAPGKTEIAKSSPFVGESGQILRTLLRQRKVKSVILNSAQCFNSDKPDIQVVKACRDAYVWPTLEQYPGVPILALGAYAASSMLKGNRSDTKTAGKVRMVEGHEVYFTYHPAYYLRSGRDPSILEHIEIMLDSALASVRYRNQQQVEVNWLNTFNEYDHWLEPDYLYVDLETTSERGPWYDSKVVICGIMSSEDTKVTLIEDVEYLKFLSNYKGVVVGHNIKFDLLHLDRNYVYFPKARVWDTMIYEKCRPEAVRGDNGLKWLGKKIFGLYGYEAEVHTQLDAGISADKIDLDTLARYCAMDVYLTKNLHEYQLQS